VKRLTATDLAISGLKRVERQQLGDARGFLSRLFCADELVEAGWTGAVAQINQTLTRRRGVVRGMHFQYPPHAEIKLVSCLRGVVFDVAVDLRKGSPTFLRWHAEELSVENRLALLIPAGFAHGFQALSDDCELLYVHSAPYVAAAEGGLSPRDSRLAIKWPLAIAEISERDAGHPAVGPDFEGVTL
jgi:dTDP-4-dehydrorhamnose 3,5-epimerase